MPTLEVDNFNIVCSILGGFIILFGLVSYLLKEKFYLSDALIATVFGLTFSHGLGWVRPLEYANNNPEDLEMITLYFSRLVLGVQLVLAGVQLPSKYLWTERKSLSILLGPGMCIMWIVTSLLTWGMVPNISILEALAVGACVTPTDPVLSNTIVKGKFADKNIPQDLQKIIIAESGANDGLGYPFLFLALYLIKYAKYGTQEYDPGSAMGQWFAETWAYTILMSVAYGFLVGWIAKELLHWAEEHRYVDRESFLVFAITLALFIVGTCGMIGSDDVLACFIAGNAFTWDDWFRQETEDDSLQPTIDMLLNVSIFLWFGSVIPWYSFLHNDIIPIWRLIILGLLVLLLRRLPMILLLHKYIHQIEELKHAVFVGFFGPIGVSAVFYIYIARHFLAHVEYVGVEREDAAHLADLIEIVVWFLVVCSIVVHGLTIPLGKLGYHLPRTVSTAISSERVSRSPSTASDQDGSDSRGIRRGPINESNYLERAFRRRRPTTSELGPAVNVPLTKQISAVGIALGKEINHAGKVVAATVTGKPWPVRQGSVIDKAQISAPMDAHPLGGTRIRREVAPDVESGTDSAATASGSGQESEKVPAADDEGEPVAVPRERAIKFGDDVGRRPVVEQSEK